MSSVELARLLRRTDVVTPIEDFNQKLADGHQLRVKLGLDPDRAGGHSRLGRSAAQAARLSGAGPYRGADRR